MCRADWPAELLDATLGTSAQACDALWGPTAFRVTGSLRSCTRSDRLPGTGRAPLSNAERKAAALTYQAKRLRAGTKAVAARNMARRAERLLAGLEEERRVAGLEEERRADKVAELRFPDGRPRWTAGVRPAHRDDSLRPDATPNPNASPPGPVPPAELDAAMQESFRGGEFLRLHRALILDASEVILQTGQGHAGDPEESTGADPCWNGSGDTPRTPSPACRSSAARRRGAGASGVIRNAPFAPLRALALPCDAAGRYLCRRRSRGRRNGGTGMSEQAEAEARLDELGRGLKEIREAQQRRENDLKALHDGFGTVAGGLVDLRGRTDELATQVQSVGSATEKVREDLTRTQSELGRLQADVKDFRSQYERDQAVLTAQFQLDRITEEWRERFGSRDKVRSLARGLVRRLTPQLVESGVLGTDNLRFFVEQHLVHDPDFWLAHATLAVAARLHGEEERQLGAMGQAQALDPGKANLFFSLAAARMGDHQRAGNWMDGYLQHAVDPDRLGRDFLVVLDAVASRELGDLAHSYARQVMVRWATEAAAGGTAARASVRRWEPHLRRLLASPGDRFAALAEAYDGDWAELLGLWRMATVTTCTLDHLHKEFPPADRTAPAAGRVRYAATAIDRLIGHLEPDEAALHTKKEALLRFIEHRGDEREAQEEHALREEADAEVMDFATLLDNAVFKPSQIALGDDARRLALMQVLPNLLTAAEELVMTSLRRRPPEIRITIEGWHASVPTDPATRVDETALVEDLDAELRARTEAEADAVDRNLPRRVGGTAGGLFALLLAPFLLGGFLLFLVLLLGAAAAAWGMLDVTRVPAERGRIRAAGAMRRQHAQRRLQDVLSRRIEFFVEWNEHAARLTELRAWDPMGK